MYKTLNKMLRQKLNNIDGLAVAKIAEALWVAMQTVQAVDGGGPAFYGECSRGIALSEELVAAFEDNVGEYVFFRDFPAFSRDEDIAKEFIRKELSHAPSKKGIQLVADCSAIEAQSNLAPIDISQCANTPTPALSHWLAESATVPALCLQVL